jgi:hypothetical protein
METLKIRCVKKDGVFNSFCCGLSKCFNCMFLVSLLKRLRVLMFPLGSLSHS